MWKVSESGDDFLFESNCFPLMISQRRKKMNLFFSINYFHKDEKN